MSDSEEILVTILAILFMGVLIVGAIIGIQYLNSWQCSQRYGDLENRYKWFVGCQIKHGGKWISSDKYRVVD